MGRERNGGGAALGGGSTGLSGAIDRVVIAGNLVSGTTGLRRGGGVWVSATSASLLSNLAILQNGADQGAGAWVDGAPRLGHLTIASNPGTGLAYGTFSQQRVITNVIIAGDAVGISSPVSSSIRLNSVLWFNNGANTAGPGPITVTGAITGNPLFAADGYHIQVGSPAINAGRASSIDTDIDGQARPLLGRDLGADEIQPVLAVAISGPASGQTGVAQAFTAIVSPAFATVPITYTWQATGQTPVVHSSGVTDLVSFTWPIAGSQVVTVTAQGVGPAQFATTTIGLTNPPTPTNTPPAGASPTSTPPGGATPTSTPVGATPTPGGAKTLFLPITVRAFIGGW